MCESTERQPFGARRSEQAESDTRYTDTVGTLSQVGDLRPRRAIKFHVRRGTRSLPAREGDWTSWSGPFPRRTMAHA